MSDKILVSDKISDDGLAVFRDAGLEVDFLPEITQEEIKERIHEYSGWVIRSRSRATADIIERAENLRVIGRAGVGVDNVDKDAATRQGIIVMNTPGGNTTSTAEHTISMLLSMSRLIPQAHCSMAEGKWDKKSFMGVEFAGKTLGILGLGKIGQEVAKRMRGFEMTILGFDPYLAQDRMRQLGVESCSVDEICERADFITVHTPLTPETKDLINAERFQKMKKTARLVNCARGGIINEEDLVKALESGTIAGAALDVFTEEPLPAEHVLRRLPNCVVTPHIAASTTEAQENVAIQVAQQIVDVLKRGQVRNALNAVSVDPELLAVLSPYMDLGERLGSFVSQYHRARVKKLKVYFSGSILKYTTSAVTTSAVIGYLKNTAEGAVNFVNAHQLLKDRGIELEEVRQSEVHEYENLVTVETVAEDGEVTRLSGTLFTPSHPRIVILNDKHFDADPYGNIVVIENDDVPGIIGQVGTFFGQRGINIGQMTWGRTEEGTAMTLINIDAEVDEPTLEDIRKLPHIKSAGLIRV